MRIYRWLTVCLMVWAMSACTDSQPLSVDASTDGASSDVSAPDGVAAMGATYYRDIKPILDTMCVRCHGPGGIRESVPLDNVESVTAWAGAIREEVEAGRMPPWKAGGGCRDYTSDESLTEGEITRISQWVEGGALPGAASDEAMPARDIDFATLSRVDVTAAMPHAYTPQQSPDDYRCFLIPWEAQDTTFITGFGAVPGNPLVVHHVIAYLVEPQALPEFQAWDEAEEQSGYTCFGGPSGPGGDIGLASGVRFLGGWAPGGIGADFPAGTGIRVEPGSAIALQVHYNTFDASPAPDLSSVVFRTDDIVEHEAFIQPWTYYGWLLGNGMEIPAGEKSVTHSWGADPFSLPIDLFNGAKGLRLYSASLHMHNLGVSASTYIERADGSQECLLSVEDYDFAWQRTYGFAEPVEIRKGDKLTIQCEWDNSPANQPFQNGVQVDPVDQAWGEGTTDEMCIGFYYMVALDE